MQWSVSYTIPYPDFPRHGRTMCVNRQAAFEWTETAKENRRFLEVCVWHGPRRVHRWHMTIEHTATGTKYKWEVYKPSTGTKFYVRKKSLANDKSIGKDVSYSTRDAAVRHADREAGQDKPANRGFV